MALFERAAGALIAAAAAVLAFPGAASAAGTPRAQFWDEPYFQGYKLDKDVSVSNSWGQWTTVPDLSKEGLSCWFCSGNWDNRITSLSTTGGGQSPVDLLAYTETYYRGMCVYIHKNVQLRDLAAEEIPVRYPDGHSGYVFLGRSISSFTIANYTFLPPPGCLVYDGPDSYP